MDNEKVDDVPPAFTAAQQRSPRDDHHDDSSFGLFNSSFDTETGGMFGMEVDDPTSNPSNPVRSSGERIFHASSATSGTGEGDNALREVKLQRDLASPDLSIGNVSPIKLVYSESPTRNEPRQDSYMNQTRYAFPPSIPVPINSHHDDDWRQNTGLAYCDRSNPFFVLRSSRKAFDNVKYLLPCLSATVGACPVNMSGIGSVRRYKEKKDDEDYSSDLTIAVRRVEAAICAFGGTLNSNRKQQTWSIFRHKGASPEERLQYERALPSRYLLSGSRISWEVEEHPPIYVDQEGGAFAVQMPSQKKAGIDAVTGDHSGNSSADSSTQSGSQRIFAEGEPRSDDLKMKYRCKLCGQPKQNHNCPHQLPLQRSIGVMVYPAVNSYTAAEPGEIAPALTKMNNFVSYDSDQGSPQPEHSSRPQGGILVSVHPSTVTPETRGSSILHSPQSSLSAPSSEDTMTSSHTSGPPAHGGKPEARGSKRSNAHLEPAAATRSESVRKSPFVASVILRPEHYRAVTLMTHDNAKFGRETPTTTTTAYQYPAVPLTFAERKRLSDTLFYLTREIHPSVTTDCAAALRNARESNEWDLAVAELLTQVVVGLYCGEGDVRLDGLQQYLLALGISC